MNLLQRLEHWGDTHHPRWLDIIRFALGVFLFFKGIEFLKNMSLMVDRMNEHVPFGNFPLIVVSHYIIFAHLLGGVLLALGMLTRFACLIQIPILLGAIIFINAPEGLMQPFSELALSIMVLLLLIYFLIAGNGRWSFDAFSEQEKQK